MKTKCHFCGADFEDDIPYYAMPYITPACAKCNKIAAKLQKKAREEMKKAVLKGIREI